MRTRGRLPTVRSCAESVDGDEKEKKGRVLGFLLNSDLPNYSSGGGDDGDGDDGDGPSPLISKNK